MDCDFGRGLLRTFEEQLRRLHQGDLAAVVAQHLDQRGRALQMRRVFFIQTLKAQRVRSDLEALASVHAFFDLSAEERRADDSDERDDHADVNDIAAVAPVVLGNEIDESLGARLRQPCGGAR